MGDAFLQALETELAAHQRSVSSNCLFCVPQERSLAANETITQDDLFTHFLTPFAPQDLSSQDHQPGEYCTLNGRRVSIVGSYIHTKTGFSEKRVVRILLSEPREIHHQQITVLHLSRPLVKGIPVPEDPNEIDVATFRRYTAILRAFPENEWVFAQLDETIEQVKRICAHDQFQSRYANQLPRLLEQEWHHGVDELLQITEMNFEDHARTPPTTSTTWLSNGTGSDSGIGTDLLTGTQEDKVTGAASSSSNGHVLQIQQVVECFLLEPLHQVLLPQMLRRCHHEESQLFRILHQMQHFTPQDFHIRKEFQCHLMDARDELIGIGQRKTPLDLLLALKKCIDAINESLQENLKRHHHVDYEAYQLTTDDLLDQLLYVIIQTFLKAHEDDDLSPQALAPHRRLSDSLADLEEDDLDADDDDDETEATARLVPLPLLAKFPLVSCLQFIEQYHFINSNTTALGFTMANFQVALAFFLLRAKKAKFHNRKRRTSSSPLSGKPDQQPQQSPVLPGITDQEEDQDDDEFIGVDVTSLMPGSTGSGAESMGCNRVAVVRRAYVRNMKAIRLSLAEYSSDSEISTRSSGEKSGLPNRLVVVGDWSTADDEHIEDDEDQKREGLGEDLTDMRERNSPPDQENTLVHEVDLHCVEHDERITQMSVGARYFGFVTSEGRLFVFGDAAGGRLGLPLVDGMPKRLVTPRVVEFGSLSERIRVVQVACGSFHTLCCDLNGHVHAWGQNTSGQLGFLPTFSRKSSAGSATSSGGLGIDRDWDVNDRQANWVELPRRVEDLRGDYISFVACGENHSLALASSGKVFSWGCNQFHQLGRKTKSFVENLQPKAIEMDWRGHPMEKPLATPDPDSLTGVPATPTVCRIAAGTHHSLAVTRQGAVFAWGKNDLGQLGLGSLADAWAPLQVLAISHPSDCFVVDAAGGDAFSVFLLRNGLCLVCGMIGKCATTPRVSSARTSSSTDRGPLLTPKLVQFPKDSGPVTAIGCGACEMSLLMANGSVLTVPVNSICRETMQWSNQITVPSPPNVKRVASGGSHSLALL